MALPEEVHHWGRALVVFILPHVPSVHSLLSMLVVEDVTLSFLFLPLCLLLAAILSQHNRLSSLGTISPNQLSFFHNSFGSGVLAQQQQRKHSQLLESQKLDISLFSGPASKGTRKGRLSNHFIT